MKWEYRIVRADIIGLVDYTLELTNLGLKGWRLVSTITQSNSTKVHFVLERPVGASDVD